MRRPFVFLSFTSALFFGWLVSSAGDMRDAYQSVCELTEEHFYKYDPPVQNWVKRCHRQAARLPSFASVSVLMQDLQDLMAEMRVSHFQIYTPAEDKRVWQGEGIDTGIRARYIEDHLVIYRIEAGSGGAKAGLRAGDAILAIEGTDQVTPWGAARRAGQFKVQRSGEVLTVAVEPEQVVVDLAPKLTRLSPNAMLLVLPSFRSEYFMPEEWRAMVGQFINSKHLIVDVRENAGGNFVAMLRALSTLHCAEKRIGKISQPRKNLPTKQNIEDNTQDDYQIRELDTYAEVGLQTFSTYGCYLGRVTVLISNETSSTAEIFADSFKNSKRGRVWGQPTAGEVVLAVWYSLPALGEGYSVSIPEAVYVSERGDDLEGKGVWPERELHYDLRQALQGIDSWLVEASQ